MELLRHLYLTSLAFTPSTTHTDGNAHINSDDAKPKKQHNAFVLSGDFLYWRPDQTGMTYCVTSNEFTDILIGSKNKEVHQTSHWGPGFRIGAGAKFIDAPCDLSFYWTRFHQTAHSSASAPVITGSQLLGLITFTIGGQDFGGGKAHSTWNLEMDQLELDLGYRLCFNERYLLRPYIGIAGGWIDQNQKIKYSQFLDTNSGVLFDSKIKQTNNFHGIGPKFGANGHLLIGAGFGIMGNLATSFFYGKAHNPVKSEIIDDPLGSPFTTVKTKYQQNRIVPIAQAQVGLTWGVKCADHFSIDLAALYEVQYFWGTWRNQNSTIQNIYVADAGYGNLMLQGGTFQLKLTF